MEEFRIILLGKSGAGKSSAGNTLLGSKPFYTSPSSQQVTQACSMSTSMVDGHKLCVVDTPGWIEFGLTEDETTKEIIKCIEISDPGPHVLLLVVPIGHFAEKEIEMAEQIVEVFGEEANKYMMVLFTRGDDLEEKTIEEYLAGHHTDLKKVIDICGGRYHVFNNRDKENNIQVSSLLEKIKAMVEKNKGKHYTKVLFRESVEQMQEKRQRNRRKREAQMSGSSLEPYNGATLRGCLEEKHEDIEDKSAYVVHTAKFHGKKSHAEKPHSEKLLTSDAKSENHSKELHKMELKWQKTEEQLQNSITKVEMTWRQEKDRMEKKVCDLQMKLSKQKNEIEKLKKELQQQQVKTDAFEKLRQESQQQREELERLKRENYMEREKIKRSFDEFDRAMDMNRGGDLKTPIRMFLSQLKKNVAHPK